MTDIFFILWLQQFSSSFLDTFFTSVTKVGNPEYYMIVVPLFYWCINKRDAFKFTMFFLLSMYVNSVIKAITAMPRPSGERVRILYNESTQGTSSFPSGHTQGTTSFWGYMSLYFKNMYFTIFSIIIIILVGISRMYLGLHFPIDVIGGLFFSLAFLILFHLLYESIVKRLDRLKWNAKITLSMIIPLILLLLPGYDKGMLVGFLIGLLIGRLLEEELVRFDNSTSLLKQIIKFLIGILGFFGLRTVLKELFIVIGLSKITVIGSDVFRYIIIGLWAAYVAPLLFVKFGLAEVERERVKVML